MLRERRLIAALFLGLILTASVVVIRANFVSASPSPYAQVETPNVTLGPPTAAAHLNPSKALMLVETKLKPSVFTPPHTIEYGSFDLADTALRLDSSSSAPERLGMRDVWKVTVTGLNPPRPCGPGSKTTGPLCPPPVQTLAIFVDDKHGQVLESEWSLLERSMGCKHLLIQQFQWLIRLARS